MNIEMTKIANFILYLLHKNVKSINDKKVSVLLFLIDYNHSKYCGKKIFEETYIKNKRQPEPKKMTELFDVIINDIDLDEDDERLYLIQELIDHLDIEIYDRQGFVELKFIQMEEEFDESLFDKDEMKTIHKIVSEYIETSPRNIANACFKIDEVREAPIGDTII
jgi:lipopolysaccharide biosynthesis regulator YciM